MKVDNADRFADTENLAKISVLGQARGLRIDLNIAHVCRREIKKMKPTLPWIYKFIEYS